MSRPADEIEQQLSTLLRRTSALHAGTAEGLVISNAVEPHG